MSEFSPALTRMAELYDELHTHADGTLGHLVGCYDAACAAVDWFDPNDFDNIRFGAVSTIVGGFSVACYLSGTDLKNDTNIKALLVIAPGGPWLHEP